MHNTNRRVGGRGTLHPHSLIRLSSPNLNYIIGAGAMVLYADVILRVIPTMSPDVAVVLCNVGTRICPWHKILVGTIYKGIKIYIILDIIRESVDSLCRDGADTPIVRVHRKAFLTRERSRSKPFWAPSYSIPAFIYPTIPPNWLKYIP